MSRAGRSGSLLDGHGRRRPERHPRRRPRQQHRGRRVRRVHGLVSIPQIFISLSLNWNVDLRPVS